MKQPEFIKDDFKIITVAPSFGVTFDPYLTRYNKSIENLTTLGIKIKEGENVHLNEGFFSSNSPKNRADEFMKAYLSDNDVIFSVGGGETMNEILPFIDFELLKRSKPKWFIGYSDNTNLTFTLTTLSDCISIYGPCITTFYESPLRLSEENTFKMLKGEKHFKGYDYYSCEINDEDNPLHRLELTEKKVITSINYKDSFSGILLGGCLDCLLNLVGTKFDKVKEFISNSNDKIIWYLESCDLNLLDIRRGLFQLINAGWFDNVSGIIFGRENKSESFYCGTGKEEAYSILNGLNVPILFDCDFGHIPPVLPIKNGARCKVSLIDNNIIMDYIN